MPSYYDDNFGFYEPSDDPEGDREFYDYVQANSVWKNCHACGRRVKLMPDYGYCDSCATKRERGYDL